MEGVELTCSCDHKLALLLGLQMVLICTVALRDFVNSVPSLLKPDDSS